MVPVALAAGAMAAIGTGGYRWISFGAGAGCLVAGMIAIRRKAWLAVVAAAVGLTVLVSTEVRNHIVHHTGLAELAQQGVSATVTGRVTADPRAISGGRTVMMTLIAHRIVAEDQAMNQSVKVVVMASNAMADSAATVTVGHEIQAQGLLTPPREGRAEAAILKLRSSPTIVAPPGPLDRGVNRFRAGLVSAVAGCPEEQRAIVPSLVVGDTAAVSEEMSEDFQMTALTHLMAVSGANLASTTALLWWVGAWCGLRRRGLRMMSVVGVAVFVVVCRAEASVVRAAAMGVVAMTATGIAFDRRGGMRTLAVAVTGLMLVDPWLVRSTGFWLSVCATAGILWWAQPWSVAMTWAPTWLAVAVTVPWAAQLATQPVVTWMAGTVSTTGLVANLAAAPFVPLASALGMVAGLAALIWPPLGTPFGRLAGWCVQPIIWIAHLGAKAPSGLLRWPAGGWALVVLAGLCVGLALLTPTVLARPWLTVLAGLAVLTATVVRPPVPGWPGQWQVAICDVAQGSAALVRAGPRQAIVVDTGPDPRRLSRCLNDLDVAQVPMVILSHFHVDHVGGLDAIRDRGPTRAVVVSPMASPEWSAERVEHTAAQLGARVVAARSGQVVTAGTARLELWAGIPDTSAHELGEESSTENNSSLVVKATVSTLTVVLPGDAESEEQRHIVVRKADITSDVLVVPHHGSSRQDEGFWAATGASVAVASVGQGNSFGHPSYQTVSLAKRMGMQLHRTDLEGTVLLARSGGSVVVQTRS
ncbi:MBL fold metallo-hydrolase [Cutibacterium sp. WCA-380-WT-3A]|uniref:MBL fold metallo-hydrolase n=1 Tax=Cutibacterium porci TaxID=2605781 RepID=A0A7K0J717_9ACTN|nr:ComEC/Rec2 family competence protein [Cutibacterium porci]MSS45750.1 MBL fold metallo-hydrolase [Cutibacterium porci]